MEEHHPMPLNLRRHLSTGLLSLGLVASMALTACGSTNTSGSNAASGPKGCKKIGFLLPESASSARWESKDHPLVVQAIQAALPGATVDVTNANGDSNTQQSQAEQDLTKGDCILVVAPHDSSAAAAIVSAAHQQNVPVIAYDRLINSTSLDYYVSFDNQKVGELQGQYIAANYQKYVTQNGNNNIYFIDGAQTDNNALLFSKGVHFILDPLITAGKLNKVYEVFTPNWDNPTAQTEMEQALTAHSNKIAIDYVANDGMAGTVIQALTAQHLNGKVLVTGQDATVAGIQQILLGNQSMTVYKPNIKEAQSTAQIVAALSNGDSASMIASTIATQTVAYNGTNIPSILDTPISLDITNANMVLTDGYWQKSDICNGIPAGTYGSGASAITCP
jgi:D-xylose transport system substrate-binding protein